MQIGGPRLDGPPIMLAGNGPRMLRLAARYADSWNTASVGVGYPDLGPTALPATLSGTPEQLAEAFRGYAELGVAHVMIEFAPHTSSALDRLAEAVRVYRASSSS